MNRLFNLQFLGPLVLFVATLSAELAAQALSYAPSSEFSLSSVAVPSGAGFYVLAGILGTSLVSFAISHLLYLRAARVES
jgi:hypothetical protein